jgi:hypothetical protein
MQPWYKSPNLYLCCGITGLVFQALPSAEMFSAQVNWTLTHMSHKDTEQSTIEAPITLDDETVTDSLIRWPPNGWPSVCREIPVSVDMMFWTSNKPAQWTLYIYIYTRIIWRVIMWLQDKWPRLPMLRCPCRVLDQIEACYAESKVPSIVRGILDLLCTEP